MLSMNKVYFSKAEDYWFVSEPEDFYTFKSVNVETNEEVNQILSWTRGLNLEDHPNHIRMYDVEVEGTKYFFLMRLFEKKYIIESENPKYLEHLVNNHNIFFVGETM